MKTTTPPAIRLIDGIPFVRVIDLAHAWDTTTSNILASCKPHHVPEEHLRRIDGRVWCSFAGLRYRMTATKHGSRIAGHIREFLDSQAVKPTATKTTAAAAPNPGPTATDLGTAALIADARRMAADAIAQATDNAHRLDAQARAIHDLQAKQTTANSETFAAKEKAAQAVSVSHASRNRARSNANRITRQAARLDKLDDRMAAMENDSYRRFDTVMARCHHVETRQGGTAVQVTRLEQRQRFALWSLAVMATVQVFAAIIRLARR